MGGKGRRRREKNYRAAHGGSHSLLPPPPKSSQVDALPSKLRKLISLTSQLHDDSAKNSMSGQENTKQEVGDAKKKRAHEEGNEATMVKDEGVEEIVEGSGDEKRKKKKKKKQVNDLRFEMGLHKSKTVEKRRERKKKLSTQYPKNLDHQQEFCWGACGAYNCFGQNHKATGIWKQRRRKTRNPRSGRTFLDVSRYNLEMWSKLPQSLLPLLSCLRMSMTHLGKGFVYKLLRPTGVAKGGLPDQGFIFRLL